MNALLGQLVEHGSLFLVVSTILLAAGCAVISLTRSPAHRQRTAELTLLVMLAWMALACCPLPRWNWNRGESSGSVGGAVRLLAATEAPREKAVAAARPADWRQTDVMRRLETAEARSPAPPANTWKFADGSLERGSTDFMLEGADPVAALEGDGPRDREGDESIMATTPMTTAGSNATIERWVNGRWWLAVAYVIGAVGCLVWLACGRLAVLRIRRTSRRPPEWLVALFASLTGAEEPARPLLLVSRRCARPMSWGVRRAVIVLPARLVRRRHLVQLRAVLLHELAHVARRDIRGDLLVCTTLPLVYFHPLFWWLRAQLRLATELLADDRASRQTGKLAYVEQLVAVARSLRGGAALWPLTTTQATTLFASHSQFYRRMQMLLARKVQLCQRPSLIWRLSSLAAAGVAIVLAAATAGIQPAAGQADETAPAAQDTKEAPSDAPAIETKDQDGSSTPEATPALPGASAGDRPKLPIAREKLQRAEVERLLAEREILKAQIEATRAQVDALSSQLDELKAKQTGDVRIDRADAHPVESSHRLNLTRVNEDGSISTEIWSTDAEGNPDKLLGKRVDQSAEESPFRSVRTTADDNGNVVKEFTKKDGTRFTYVYDAGTGRVISRKFYHDRAVPGIVGANNTPGFDFNNPALRGSSPPPGGDAATADPPSPNAPLGRASLKVGDRLRLSALRNEELRMKSRARKIADDDAQPDSTESSATGASTGRSPADLDLVGLVTAYSDALAETDEAQMALSEVPESRAAQVALRSARRKQRFLKMFVEEAASSAKSKLEYSRKMASRGYVTADAVANAEFRLRILTDILNAESDAPADVPKGR